MTPPSRLCGLESQQDGLRKSLSAMREPGLTAKGSYAAHTRGYLSMMSEAQNFPPMGTFACSTNRAAFSAADVGRCHTSAMPDCGDNAFLRTCADAGLSQCDLTHKRPPGPPR